MIARVFSSRKFLQDVSRRNFGTESIAKNPQNQTSQQTSKLFQMLNLLA
jgi:hypothetical protein